MRYSAYGLRFESELPFPEFPTAPASGPADVNIGVGAVPENLREPLAGGVLYQASADEFLLHMPDVASYHVTRDRITVSPSGATEHEVRVFLLGSAMGALLHLRSLLVVHAAAYATDRGAVLIAGHSGAGKSTLLGAMLDRGYRMIVDDVCAVDLVDQRPTVLPGYPRTRLWADSAAKLEIDTEPLVRTRPTLEKFERQVEDRFDPSAQPLAALYVLRAHTGDDLRVERLTAIDAFGSVLGNTYRRTFLDGLAMRDEHFKLASAVAATTPIVRIHRPMAGFDLDALADLVEAETAEPALP